MAVLPPGDAARSIKPTASKGGSAKTLQMIKAILTKITNWQNKAIKTALGCFVTRVKSLGVSSSPKPIMMMASAKGNKMVMIPESIQNLRSRVGFI